MAAALLLAAVRAAFLIAAVLQLCTATLLAAGPYHSCGIKQTGQIKCWGSNTHGESLPPADATFSQVVVGDASGGQFSCGITIDGQIKCWGDEPSIGMFLQMSTAGVFEQIAAGAHHVCGIDHVGVTTCWGKNTKGEVIVPAGQLFQDVSCGKAHTCGIQKNTRKLICWGDPNPVSRKIYPPTGEFRLVSCSGGYSCALRIDGFVFCWGDTGPSGRGDPPNSQFVAINSGPVHSCGVHINQTLECWGGNGYNQPEPDRILPPAGLFSMVACGQAHTCAVRIGQQGKQDTNVICWGKKVALIENQGLVPPQSDIGCARVSGNEALFDLGRTSCTSNCPPGTILNSTQGICSTCASGQFSNISNSLICTACQGGQYQENIGDPKGCKGCRVGRFSKISSPHCDLCAVGQFVARPGQSACDDCEAGYFRSTVVEAESWNIGGEQLKVLQSGAGCIHCRQGYFQSKFGSSRCVKCPSGKHSTTSASKRSRCVACTPGRSNNQSAQASCTHCESGRFNNISARPVCEACAAGKYIGTTGSRTCSSCAEGQAVSKIGSTTCDACKVGRYSSVSGAISCIKCVAGQKRGKEDSNATGCVKCAAGLFSNYAGFSWCLPCPNGKFNLETGLNRCLSCQAGFSTFSGTRCTACAAGRYAGTLGLSSCTACAAGRYNDGKKLHSSIVCSQCSPARFADTAGAVSCRACEPGQQAAEWGRTNCSICPPGSFRRVPSNNSGEVSHCELCPAGKMSKLFASASCTACAVGRFTPRKGFTRCTSCPRSYYTPPNADGTGCEACMPGRYAYEMLRQFWTCSPCPSGYFAENSLALKCLVCTIGRTSERGSSNCSRCTPGLYADDFGLPTCEACATGRYSSSFGSASCEACVAGRYALEIRQAYCSFCRPGKYSSVLGSVSCIGCPPGQYREVLPGQTCLPCELGTYTARNASIVCSACPVGYFSSKDSHLFSPEAAEKHKQKQNVQAEEQYYRCSMWSPKNKCGNCEAKSSSGREEKCGGSGSTKYCVLVNSPRCPEKSRRTTDDEIIRRAGQVNATNAVKDSTLMASNVALRYLSTSNTTNTTSISLNAFKFNSTNKTLVVEDGGEDSVQTGIITACAACPRGYLQAREGNTACVECTPGRLSSKIGSSICTACAAGEFCDKHGLTRSAGGCPSGKFSATGQVYCSFCRPGKYTLGDSAISGTCLECQHPERCLGGVGCAVGFSGLACSECARSFYSFGDSCRACETFYSTGQWIAIAGIIVACVVGAWCIFKGMVKRHYRNADDQSNRMAALHSQVVALSILMNYLQNVTIFISFDLNWPDWLVQLASSLGSLFLLDFVQLAVPECSVKLSYFTRSVLCLFTPLLILIVFFVVKRIAFLHARVKAFDSWSKRDSIQHMDSKELHLHLSQTKVEFNTSYKLAKKYAKQRKSSLHPSLLAGNSDATLLNATMALQNSSPTNSEGSDGSPSSRKKSTAVNRWAAAAKATGRAALTEKKRKEEAEIKNLNHTAAIEVELDYIGVNLLVFLYISLASRTLQPFNCIPDNSGSQFLAADPSLKCWQGNHLTLAGLCATAFVTYTFVLPLRYRQAFEVFASTKYLPRLLNWEVLLLLGKIISAASASLLTGQWWLQLTLNLVFTTYVCAAQIALYFRYHPCWLHLFLRKEGAGGLSLEQEAKLRGPYTDSIMNVLSLFTLTSLEAALLMGGLTRWLGLSKETSGKLFVLPYIVMMMIALAALIFHCITGKANEDESIEPEKPGHAKGRRKSSRKKTAFVITTDKVDGSIVTHGEVSVRRKGTTAGVITRKDTATVFGKSEQERKTSHFFETNPMQAREGQEAFDLMVSSNEEDYGRMKRKGTATRFFPDSDDDSDDAGGSLSLKQRQWFFPAYIAMAPAPTLADYGRGMKELPDELSVCVGRDGLQLVAPDDSTGKEPLRTWSWAEISSYCANTTEEDNCEFDAVDLHSACRSHKQRLLKQYKKGKLQGMQSGSAKKPMRKKTQASIRMQPAPANSAPNQVERDESRLRGGGLVDIEQQAAMAGIDGVVAQDHRFVI